MKRRSVFPLALMLVTMVACQEKVLDPLPPVADPPAYTSCTITYSSIATDQEYYRISTADGRRDTLEHGVRRDTLGQTTFVIDGLKADGYVLTRTVRKSGYRLSTQWDSTRSVRAEFDAQNGNLLLLHFEHGDGSSMRSPGGLDFEDHRLITVRGEGFKAGADGAFHWDSAEKARSFFHSVKMADYSRSQSIHTESESVGMDFIEGTKIIVRFH